MKSKDSNYKKSVSCHARHPSFGMTMTKTLRSRDVRHVVGADVIYIEETFPLLLKTLVDLTDSNTQVMYIE